MKILEAYINTLIEAYFEEEFDDATAKLDYSSSDKEESHEFNIQNLQQIMGLPEVLNYVGTTLGHAKIGEGQGRYVYRIGKGLVLKVAKNGGGIGQNKAEMAACSSEGAASLFPTIISSNPQGMWIVVEEASPMTRVIFKELTGMSWGEFNSALGGAFPNKVSRHRTTSGEIQQSRENFDKFFSNPFFRKVIDTVKTCKYEPGDIAKLDSWGVVNGQPVIIDSGFTEDVNQAYYQG
jgi:hypothetical protein